MKKLVNLLKNKNQTISCMESCTGGMLASEITNIDGSSNIFKVGLVTYSNEYKIHFGVSKQKIDTYTVYSKEVAQEMAKQVSNLAKSDYGIGITGQLGTKDLTNNSEQLNTVYICIYSKNYNVYNDFKIEPKGNDKYEKKTFIVNFVKENLYEICK